MTRLATGRDAPSISTVRAMLLIARRGMVEALRDRMTVLVSGAFAIGLPVLFLLTAVRSTAATLDSAAALGAVLGTFLLVVAVPPATVAVGVAAGQFAGELEQGNLTPLLASPASNVAIFGGKVLGSVVPALLFSLLAELTYLAGAAALLGPPSLALIPPWLALGVQALVPAVALFAAGVASLISSRVRTYNSAQQLASFALLPLWGALFGTSFQLFAWGPWALAAIILVLLGVDIALIVLAAKSWRREEVLG